jgi:hypothetical protein
MSRTRFVVAAALFALCASVRADVLVVDAAGHGGSTSLLNAVAAAADGDTLLVRPGDYRVFQTKLSISKALVIAADGTGPVLINAVEFGLADPGKHGVLRGLTIEAGTFDPTTTGLALNGDIFVEGCTILGRDGNPAFANAFGGTAATISGGNVVFKDCLLEGGRGSDATAAVFLGSQPGGTGLQVFGAATVAVHGGSIAGGQGGNFVPGGFSLIGPGARGGTAVLANFEGAVLLAGCSVSGGHGGNGTENPGNFSGGLYAGGDAVTIFGQIALSLLDTSLVAGAPGVDGAGQPGPAGHELVSGPLCVVVQHPGAYRSNSFGAPASEGDSLGLQYDGVAGDLLGLFLSLAPATQPLPGKQGDFHLGAPLLGPFIVGPVGVGGSLSLGFSVPNLGLQPDDALLIYQQAFVKPATGPTLLSSPTTAVLLDSSL